MPCLFYETQVFACEHVQVRSRYTRGFHRGQTRELYEVDGWVLCADNRSGLTRIKLSGEGTGSWFNQCRHLRSTHWYFG